MTSKTQRRKFRKAAKIGQPDFALAGIEHRQPSGRVRNRDDGAKDPRKTALEARCRRFGMATTAANMKALAGQHIGAHVGLVMERECKEAEIARLWAVWQGFCAAERTYRIRYIGQTGTPKGAAIAMVPDRMETDQSHSVDLRDSDQRDRDAVSAWMAWRGHLMHLSAYDQRLIHDAETEAGGALWANAGPTGRGVATLLALRRLAKVVDGRR
jgi:hypothetical protein